MDYAVLQRLVLRDDDFDAKHPRDDRGRFAEGGGGAGEPSGGGRREGGLGRAVTEQVPRESAKAALARQTSRLVNAEVQRYSEEGCEPVLAKGLGGVSLKDNEPADVIVLEKGVVKHGVELKVMTDNKQNKVYMKQKAIDRKVAFMRENRADFHTVVFDDTNVYNAGGKGHHDDSQRRVFYRRGFGSFRVDVMHEVTGGMRELKRLMAAPMKELPEAARHSGKTPYPRVRPRKGWFAEAFGRVVRYSPDQPRDEGGRFGEGGGTSSRGTKTKESQQEWRASLSRDERAGIEEWSSGGYREFREADLRGAEKTGRYGAFHAALERSPRQEGTVYRGMAMLNDADVEDLTTPGNEVKLEATASASMSESLAQSFTMRAVGERENNAKPRVLMEIAARTGTDLTSTLNPETSIFADNLEKEVVLHKGTRYRVVSSELKTLPEPKGGWKSPDDPDEFVPSYMRSYHHVKLEEM